MSKGHEHRRIAASGSSLPRVGDAVVVKRGVADPDFPEVHLDGWRGVVILIERRTPPPRYLVRWNRGFLNRLPRKHRSRCESEDLAIDRMWLFGEDFEDRGDAAGLGER